MRGGRCSVRTSWGREFPIARLAVEVTDSRTWWRTCGSMCAWQVAQDKLGSSKDFVPGLHSWEIGSLRRLIAHFRAEGLIWSVGSGYGGNALLGNRMFALRIASLTWRGSKVDAEHM